MLPGGIILPGSIAGDLVKTDEYMYVTGFGIIQG